MEHLFTTIILINALVVKRKNNNTSFFEDVKSQFAQRRKKDQGRKDNRPIKHGVDSLSLGRTQYNIIYSICQ